MSSVLTTSSKGFAPKHLKPVVSFPGVATKTIAC